MLNENRQSVIGHLFVVMVGLAALPHSLWSSSTIMQGTEPAFPSYHWLAWAVSGLLLGIALDAGLIVISIQIAAGERTRARYIAFGVLTVIQFYLQWYYAAAHVPLTQLGVGINSQAMSAAIGLRDAGVWIVPSLLPATILIYTFGYPARKKARNTATITQTKTSVKIEMPGNAEPEPSAIASANLPAIEAGSQSAETYVAKCDDCDWLRSYPAKRSATNALVAHRKHAHPKEG